jgi:hypothetical protein
VRSGKASARAAESANTGRAFERPGEGLKAEATSTRPTCLWIYGGQRYIGHLLLLGRDGVEAFDRDDRSLGLYPDQKAAADAISKVAS